MSARTSTRILLTLACIAGVACKKSDDPATPTSAAVSAGAPTRSDTPLALPPAIPASAVIVGALEAPADWTASVAGMGVFDATVARAAMADLDAYLTRTTGVSLARVQRAAFFVTADGKPAALIASVSGAWKLDTPPDVKIVMHDGWMVIGEPSAVDLAIATAAGDRPRLADDSVLAKLFARESRGALIAAAVDVAQLPPQARMAAATYGVERAALSVGRSLRAVAEGNADGLGKLVQLYDQQTAGVVQVLEAQRASALTNASADRGPDPEEVGIILGSHLARAAVQLVRPKLANDRLTVELALPGDAAMVVPMIGVLAAIAVPAFVKYQERAAAARDLAAPEPIEPAR